MAVNGLTLQLETPGIVGLVGPNGSGKSTLFHLITGFYQLDGGAVYFKGRRISGLSPHLISRMGLVRTFQNSRVLPFLTTRENLMAAASRQAGECLTNVFLRPDKVRRGEKKAGERAAEVLDRLNLTAMARQLAGRLSYGQQKLLELGRVLMAEPDMILLDEPTAGINPTLIRQLVEVITGLSRQGIRIFLIEHNMPLVAEICRQVFVMDSGSLIYAGTPEDARQNPRVIEAYLGTDAHAA